MNDCGFCLSDGDYDAPEFYSERIVAARKPHKCCECYRTIERGKLYQLATGKWEGDFNSYKTCLDCMHIRNAFACNGSFLFQGLWDTLLEYENDLKMDCVKNIKTVSAKEYYLERLRKMRGIT